MNPIRVRRRRQRRLEIIDGFRITPPGQRYLSETVVRGSVTSLDLQGYFETSFRLFQAVYLKVDVTQVQINRLEERSEEHTSELQSRPHLVCRLLLEKKKKETVLNHDSINKKD